MRKKTRQKQDSVTLVIYNEWKKPALINRSNYGGEGRESGNMGHKVQDLYEN